MEFYMFSSDTKEVFLVVIRAPDNPGILMDRKGQNICVYSTLANALTSIQFQNDASSLISYMAFRPCIIRVEANTEKDLNDFMTERAKKVDGKFHMANLSNVSGVMTVLSTDPTVDWTPYIVDEFKQAFSPEKDNP